MNTFEITIQRLHHGSWPVIVRHQPGPISLTSWSQGVFDLDLQQLDLLLPADRRYGMLLGENLFRDQVRDAFVRAVSGASTASELLRVWLIIEAEDLRTRHWEQLCAPFAGGRWDYLLLNQQTPFSLYLPSRIERRFPPIGRRDLRALLLVAGPEELQGDYPLARFDVPATVAAMSASLGQIPHDVLASPVEGAVGEPNLDTLCERLTASPYTLLFIVCHGAYHKEDGETILYLPEGDRRRPVTGSQLLTRLSRLEGAHGLPHFTFLSTCESADPRAENGLGGLGQRLVRELGMPAVLAMTERVSIQTAQALAAAFCTRLGEHGEVDRALAEALTPLQGRYDVTVPALFSRLGGRPLFSDALDRPLTGNEIRYGLEQMGELLRERAPVLVEELQALSAKIQVALGADTAARSPAARLELETSLAAANQLCSQALDVSFNALALGHSPPEYDARPPFRGLYPFRAEDRDFFFGRQALVDQLVKRLDEHPFLAVLGPSGCGKSSLVLAGLLPTLGAPLVYRTPGSDPFAQLETALESFEPGSFLVIDQFEELFTLCSDEGKRQAFLERLLATIGKMRVVITLRADFLGECAAYPGLRAAIESHQALIGSMSPAELRQAMERQAARVGLRFESGLGEQILDDVQGEPGAMPLLQHALLLLWQRRHGRWLRWEEYTKIGGIREAIAHTAEEVYSRLSEPEKARMRAIFIRLTRPPEAERSQEGARYTRRRVRLAELVPAGSDRAATTLLVTRLADARLIVTRQQEGTDEVEVDVAHEALIQYWPRLRHWLEENRADILLREALTQAARDWESLDRDVDALYRGARLAQASEWAGEHPAELNLLEQDFLVASQELARREEDAREAQRQRELALAQEKAETERRRAEEQARARSGLQRLSIGLAVIFVIAVAAAIFALSQQKAAVASATESVHAQGTAEGRRIEAVQAQGTAEERRLEAEAQRATAVAASTQAVAERNLAAAAQADAELQANRARAGELVAYSLSQRDQDPDLALLLAVQAYRTAPTLQTEQALFQSWTYNPQLTGFLKGHRGRVSSLAWSPDGRLASGSDDGVIVLWNLESNQPDLTLQGLRGGVNSLVWSPDGHLASDITDGTIILWDLESGQPAYTLPGDGVFSLAWSPNGRLASGGYNSSLHQTVTVWDLENRQPAKTLTQKEGGSEFILNVTVAWSRDGRLASQGYGSTVIVWNPESSQPPQVLLAPRRAQTLAWSPDGRLATASLTDYADVSSHYGEIILWDLESGQPSQTLLGHSSQVQSLAWSRDGVLASASSDGTVIVWDLESGQPAQTLRGHTSPVISLAWSPDGRLASGSDDGTIILWDPNKLQAAQTMQGHSEWVNSMNWRPDGQLASESLDDTVILWDLESGQPAQILEEPGGDAASVAFSPDGQLALGSWDGPIMLWDPESGQPPVTLQGHKDLVDSLAWSPDGRLASGSWDKTVIVWDLDSGQPAQTLQGHTWHVDSLAWSPDGPLASASCAEVVEEICKSQSEIILWDLESGQPAQTLQEHSGRVKSLAWSPDGRLASGSDDGTVVLWDLESGLPDRTLQGHKDVVSSLAWSPDGRLASASLDGTVILWDLESGQPAYSLPGESDGVFSLAWSPDGRLAAGLYHGTIQVWETRPAVWVDQICRRAGRNLTQAEWEKYIPWKPFDPTYRTCPQWPPGE